ncbi:Hypothetical predicted protein [Xyrichtys novacula]|uniref:Uncharacterized protein n=1 Tax=Xyrichtys novacula TaxID=13765 RepID=A0AAV1F3M1_XYRNO|nr:Hypothetical predicted protein [Xyrichtys novacula]
MSTCLATVLSDKCPLFLKKKKEFSHLNTEEGKDGFLTENGNYYVPNSFDSVVLCSVYLSADWGGWSSSSSSSSSCFSSSFSRVSVRSLRAEQSSSFSLNEPELVFQTNWTFPSVQ